MKASSSGLAGVWAHRRIERWLFLLILLVVAAGWAPLLLIRIGQAPVIQLRQVTPLLIFAGALPVTHLLFVLFGLKGDPVLPSAVLMLTGLGLLAQFRMGTFDPAAAGMSQLAFPIGLGAMIAVAVIFRSGRHRALAPLAIPALLASAALLAVIVFGGRRFRGAMFLPGNINPAEFVKILLVIFLAGFLCAHRRELEPSVAGMPAPTPRTALTLLLLWGLPMGLLLLQHDLGMIILLNVTLVIMLYQATRRPGWLVAGLFLALAAGALLFRFTAHGRARLAVWLDPFQYETGAAWQVLQALSAMYSGGLWGTGVGAGFPQTIPIASSDFIYAALGEEIGFAGCGILLLFYLLFLARGLRAAFAERDPFGQLMGIGLVTLLAVQTLWNIGGVTKALPLTGIPLPFISQGGSSLITCLAMAGMLIAMSDSGGGKPAGGARKKPQKKRAEKGT